MSTEEDDLAASWGAALEEEGSAAEAPDAKRVLNQAEIDSLLGFEAGGGQPDTQTGMQRIVTAGQLSVVVPDSAEPHQRRVTHQVEERVGHVHRHALPTLAAVENHWFSRLAITLTVVARITAPNKNEISACRSTWRRISRRVMSVSDTWNVMPIVNAR